MASSAFELGKDECIRVNEQLRKALQNDVESTILDLISALQASDANGKLKVSISACMRRSLALHRMHTPRPERMSNVACFRLNMCSI